MVDGREVQMSTPTVTLTIDDKEVTVEKGLTVLQACEAAGIEVPRFCFHDRLSIAGNCRMCLVQMKGSPKAIASCAMPAGDGMEIDTVSDRVQRKRKAVMEMLLINHPLDCPICDQGGECDLQDQAMAYGMDRGRFYENKRAVKDKNWGPLIKTHMTRCIHCTRCIRFAQEVAGVTEIGATGRGEDMEVGTYVEKSLSSVLSGNLIDLCPVGALTSKPYAFVARPWELDKTETVDVMDAVGSNIRVDARGEEVLRVLPRVNEDINEEWISDRTRFACDGLRRQRLDKPYVRLDGKLRPVSWGEAFQVIADRLAGLDGQRIAAITGDLVDCESMLLLKQLMDALGSPNVDCRQDGAQLDAGVRAGYLFNTSIAGIEDADACLIIASNVRYAAPIINARLRKRIRYPGNELPVGLIGPSHVNLTYTCVPVGTGPLAMEELKAGNHPFADVLTKAERPMLLLGMSALTRPDGSAILSAARSVAEHFGMIKPDEGWNGFNILHNAAARVGGLDLGLVPGEGGRNVEGILSGAESGEIGAVYLLGADECDVSRLKNSFVIYQGHHGDAGAHVADVILPGAAYTEKTATYVNTEGRVQRASLVCHPPGDAREDWKILRALSEKVGHTLPYTTAADVYDGLVRANPVFEYSDEIVPAAWGDFGKPGQLDETPFEVRPRSFYLSNPICRASPTMAECARTLERDSVKKTGTDG
jgi:NADH-quinone oxidoreductase subunit G